MKASLHHIQIHIEFTNITFYQDLMKFLGWNVIYQDNSIAGFRDENNKDVWFSEKKVDVENNYDGIGMNHLAFKVGSQAEVDKTVEYLKEKKVTPLFKTPRHRPEFAENKEDTYYQIMFESPDKILLEVFYLGKKSL